MRILVNAVNSASAGGLGVLRGLVPALGRVAERDDIIALVPQGAAALLNGHRGRLHVVELPRSGPRHLWRLADDLFRLPALARRLAPDVVFSTTDLGPADLGCPQVMLMHNPWVAYRVPRRRIGFSLRDQLIYATYYPARFRRLWPRLARIIVQTPVMGHRLRARFGVPEERIAVIPPGSLLSEADNTPPRRRVTPEEPLHLFWPARGYWHKNHQVLPRLCQQLHRQGLADHVRIVVTLDPAADLRTRRLVDAMRPYQSIVTNLGPLTKSEVERGFDEADALFLPTLLESYSLTYLEAAARRRPVLTSDLDFARHACGAAGYYFDPHDPVDICRQVRSLINDMAEGTVRVPRPAGEQVSLSWDSVARRVLSLLKDAAASGSPTGGRTSAVSNIGGRDAR